MASAWMKPAPSRVTPLSFRNSVVGTTPVASTTRSAGKVSPLCVSIPSRRSVPVKRSTVSSRHRDPALARDRVEERRNLRRLEKGEYARTGLDQGDRKPEPLQREGHLHAEIASPDDYGPATPLGGGADCIRLGPLAQIVDARKVVAGRRTSPWRGS